MNLGPKLVQKLFTKCYQLTEFNSNLICDSPQVCALVENVTPNILKLNLSGLRVKDQHVTTLVQRCNKITELSLWNTSITNDSVNSIVENLNSLEKLDLGYNKIGLTTLLRLKLIPTLKTLCWFSHAGKEDIEKIKNLKLQLPHISINQPEDFVQIANPTKKVNGSIDWDWIWEIRAYQQDLFPRR